MRPLMLLLVSVPLLIGALALVAAQTSVRELLLPPPAQWTWAHKVRAAGFASGEPRPRNTPELSQMRLGSFRAAMPS